MTIRLSPALRRGPKAVKLPVPLEHDEQVAFVNWFEFQFPKVLIYAIPNGASLSGTPKRRAAQMARLKAEGFKPGMPDTHIPEWRMWVEMKRRKGGRLSEEQATIHAYLRGIGDIVIVAEGWEDAKAKLLAALAEASA